MRDTKINATIQSAGKSQLAWLKAAAPLKALWPGQKGHLPGTRWQTASVLPAPKKCSKKVPFLWCQEATNNLYVTEGTAVLWEWGISKTAITQVSLLCFPDIPRLTTT